MVSLLIAAYNESAELPACLDSLLQQHDKNFRVILVDNNSTDNTLEIMNSFKHQAEDQGFEVIVGQESKPGKREAISTAARLALDTETSFLAFSDADVHFPPLWSSQVNAFIEKNPTVGFGFTNEYFKQPDLLRVPNFYFTLTTYTFWRDQLKRSIGGFMVMNNCLVNADAYRKVGGVDAHWTQSLDTLLTVKLMLAGYRGDYYHAPVVASPRRLLDNGNIQKWCLDGNIREYVEDRGIENWKPIRGNEQGEYTFDNLVDIKLRTAKESLRNRSIRLFKRILILSVLDLQDQNGVFGKIQEKFRHFGLEEDLKYWEQKRHELQSKYDPSQQSPDEFYYMIKDIVEQEEQSLVRRGADQIRKIYDMSL